MVQKWKIVFVYLFIVEGGEENKAENKLSYFPSGQALMIGLKRSNTWCAQLLFQEHTLYLWLEAVLVC